MNQECILIVEDDKGINKLLCEYLSGQGYKVLSAFQGLEAMNMFHMHNDIRLVLLDIMLPFQSGDSVLKKLREISSVPVIILSAKDTVQTKVDLIRMGADDYITKPFDLDEVLVRIEAVLRRSVGNGEGSLNKGNTVTQEVITFKEMCLDTEQKVVYVKGHPLVLTGKEYSILELMLKNPNKLFSKANLFESVWNEVYYSEDNTLKVHMSNIRNKIKQYDEEEYVETVWGMGYKLKN
ncbi:MAG: response regulator transcription factor [Lachnospiraceae bacterium]|nr:response regulator transcription factor [Lachnospiraceae bacterium]